MEGLNSGVAQEILNNREEEIYRSIRHYLDDLSKGLETGLDTMGGDAFSLFEVGKSAIFRGEMPTL